MKTNPLGRTGLMVTDLCLGTMTFGTQTDEADAHAQIDLALDRGLNFIDTAEMYPVNPVAKETIGKTEEIIGRWIAKSGRRAEWILATKHSGAGLGYVRDGAPISAKTIPGTIEGNLKRLQTDYIDLYQFHWPNRGSYMFRQNWDYDPSSQNKEETLDNMLECLHALQKEVDRGTIRHFGLSNESCWGTAQWLRLSEDNNLPRVASIQNEYSLLDRKYDTDLAELSVNEDVGLLAFSPLATGFLTGKYRNGAVPKGSRMDISTGLSGRNQPRTHAAVEAYADIADAHGLDLTQMSLAWCTTRPFMCSAIFGATTVDQLDHLLGAADLSLSKEVLEAINAAHRLHPMPY